MKARDKNRTIWQFAFVIKDSFTIQMPVGAIIRHVGVVRNMTSMWAEVTVPATEVEDRHFQMSGTGHHLPMGAYVGSFVQSGFVGHVYEILESDEEPGEESAEAPVNETCMWVCWRVCGKPANSLGFCEEHTRKKCHCGKQSTNGCDLTVGGLVCGNYLCDACSCRMGHR